MNEIEREQLCEMALDCFRDSIGGLEHLPPLIEKINQPITLDFTAPCPDKGWAATLDKNAPPDWFARPL